MATNYFRAMHVKSVTGVERIFPCFARAYKLLFIPGPGSWCFHLCNTEHDVRYVTQELLL